MEIFVGICILIAFILINVGLLALIDYKKRIKELISKKNKVEKK